MLRLESVVFGYEPRFAVLQGISLEAHPGETVAIIGPTGAGKSTLVSLIPRFFDPWQGRVMVDGMDVRRIRITSLRAQVAVVTNGFYRRYYNLQRGAAGPAQTAAAHNV